MARSKGQGQAGGKKQGNNATTSAAGSSSGAKGRKRNQNANVQVGMNTDFNSEIDSTIFKLKQRLQSQRGRIFVSAPLIIQADVDQCPVCPYRSEHKHIDRHFQSKHKRELEQVWMGTHVYPGISKKSSVNLSPEEIASILKVEKKESTSTRKRKLSKPQITAPVLLAATVNKCPLCPYFSLYNTHVARHFQARHKPETNLILEGRQVFTGIGRKESRYSKASKTQNPNMNPTCSAQAMYGNQYHYQAPPVQTVASQSAALQLHATDIKCPLCPYISLCYLASHFEQVHVYEFHQILNGQAVYPGITIKSKKRTKRVSTVESEGGSEKGNAHPMSEEITSSNSNSSSSSNSFTSNSSCFSDPKFSNSFSATETFLDHQALLLSTPIKETDVVTAMQTAYTLQDDFLEQTYASASSLVVSEKKRNKKAKSKSCRTPSPSPSMTLLNCPFGDCRFRTDSHYSLMVHKNFHEIPNCLAPFVKAVIEATEEYGVDPKIM